MTTVNTATTITSNGNGKGGKKQRLILQNTDLKQENDELKNKLAQMELLLKQLSASDSIPQLPTTTTTTASSTASASNVPSSLSIPQIVAEKGKNLADEDEDEGLGELIGPQHRNNSLTFDDADDEGDYDSPQNEGGEGEEVFTLEFQAHQLVSESNEDVGYVIDGVSVTKKKRRKNHKKDRKRRSKKKPNKTHSKLRRKRKQKPRTKKGKNARKRERAISFTATTCLPDVVLASSRDPPEQCTEDAKKTLLATLLEKGYQVKPASSTETVRKLLHDELAKGKKSAFYLVNLGHLAEKLAQWRKHLPRVEPHYAMKCNPDRAIVQSLHDLGIGFDCASKRELELAFEVGSEASQIIFANPCKQEEHIAFAKAKGVKLMTFDSVDELKKMYAIYPEAEIVLRILPDDSHSMMPFGTKFGANKEEVTAILKACQEIKANLVGVSFHVGSGCYSVDAYLDALRLARSVFDEAETYGFHFNFLDIGGGFPGISSSHLYYSSDSDDDSYKGYESGTGHDTGLSVSFEEIAYELGPLLDELFPPHVRVISEPGRFFVTAAATLAVNVVSRRERVRGYLNQSTFMNGKFVRSQTKAAIAASSSDTEGEINIINESESETEGASTQLPSGQLGEFTKEVLYYLSDGIYGSFNNIIFDHANPLPALLSSTSLVGENSKTERSCLFGPTCDSIDVICKNVELPPLNVGDWLYFVNMGAYTTASASNFNGISMPDYHYIIAFDPDSLP